MHRSHTSLISKVLVAMLLIVMSFAVIVPVVRSTESPYQRDSEAETQILTELNRWRIRRGLMPLARNVDLDDMAYAQAIYKAPEIPFTGDVDFHSDEYGEGIVKRASSFGWPAYDGLEGREFVSEIAAYYVTIHGAINFWQHSTPHRRAVETAGFREAGVAVLDYKGWKLSYVVLGSRPAVLPVLYDPERRVLFLSTDLSPNSDDFQPTRIQIMDAYGNRIHPELWLSWSNRVRLPKGVIGPLTILQTDGILRYTTTVDLTRDRVFPSDPLPTPELISTPVRTATPPLYTSTPYPPTPTPFPTATAVNSHYDVLLVYDDLTLTLINQSGRELNLHPLNFISDELELARTGDWLGAFSKMPVSSFPAGYCMQAWSFKMMKQQPKLPQQCTLLASGRSVLAPGQRFWVPNRFRVDYFGQLLAVCDSQAHECAFDIPDR